MATVLFSDATYPVSELVRLIERGELALPDIQRPFVWSAAKVRSLFDSMYKGFPVGFLLLWETGADQNARQIGDAGVAPSLLIVDGQQRLTSLFAVMTGRPVMREDYRWTPIPIAFRPRDATFAVTDAAIKQDPEFIPDISVVWRSDGPYEVARTFLDRLSRRHDELGREVENQVHRAISRLHNLENYIIRALQLSADIDEEQVAEVFVRINSEGVTLNQADFILTLMSVFWDQCHLA